MAHFFNPKGFLEEFKAFALKGNVIDLAVAVVIGGAFNKIVSVFVIIAFSIFVAIKLIGSLRRKSEETPAAPAPKPDDVVLLEQIRDILQKQADVK